MPPSAIRMIFQFTQDKIGEYAGRIDFIESGTAPLPEPDKERLARLLPGTRLYNNYGSSEIASVCMYDYSRYSGKAGCVGKVLPGQNVMIVDEGHRLVSASKANPGLIACAGETAMTGYVGDPILTRKVLDGGIVYTNDIGYIDKDGFVYVLGRKGDVINVGGLKVSPEEVESAALGFASIDDCVCVPVDDCITGKALKLLVVVHGGGELDKRALVESLKARLESYKVPHIFAAVDKIERTYNGKVNRRYYRNIAVI